MSRLDRLIGLARSLAVYYAIPFRHRRLQTLYGQFVRPGDLVFDVGAHLGNRTRAFAALGCRVVALEPQPHVAALLRRLTRTMSGITVVERAVGAAPGRTELAISERTPTVSTIAADWRAAREREAGFERVAWATRVPVEVTTLDRLVAEHGMPAFVKIDIEGGELAALQGLTHAVDALSFEFLPTALDQAAACVARIETLGDYRFNWSSAETGRLALESWVDGASVLRDLRGQASTRHGDIYARHVTAAATAADRRPAPTPRSRPPD